MSKFPNETKELSFYHLGNEHQRLMGELYDRETGELNTEVEAQLNALYPTTEKKCIGVVQWIKKLEAEKRELDYMKEELAKRQAAYEKEINAKRDYLISNMQRCDITKISCPQFTIKLTKNQPATNIIDESLIPEEFIVTKEIVKIEKRVDKMAIKKHTIDTGEQVPGTEVKQSTRLEIVIDKI